MNTGLNFGDLMQAVFLGLIILLMAYLIWFWIAMLIDCIKNEPEGDSKTNWLLVLLLSHMIGAFIYDHQRRRPRLARERKLKNKR